MEEGSNALREYVFWLCALRFTDGSRSQPPDREVMARATAAARSWLGRLDRGDHAGSFAQAALVVRRAVSEEQWDRAVRAVRTPLGRCLSRRLRSRRLVASPSRGPGGPYAVIEFESDFEGKAKVVETLAPALGPDGRWRVAGYLVA